MYENTNLDQEAPFVTCYTAANTLLSIADYAAFGGSRLKKMAERKRVEDQIVRLDYSTIRDTDLVRCKLVFEGGRPPQLDNVQIEECEFIFEGPARNTQNFLTLLAHVEPELVVNAMLGLSDWKKIDD